VFSLITSHPGLIQRSSINGTSFSFELLVSELPMPWSAALRLLEPPSHE
jgi:hypothetical protein